MESELCDLRIEYASRYMRDEMEGRKKASKVKQTTKQISNTAHPRQPLFLRK